MNCANHADASAVAYCRTCGKALCANCTRPVRGVIYCEDCLGAKMEGAPAGATAAAPPTPFYPAASGPIPPLPPLPPPPPSASGSGPNPTVAGILAGFFPFGVGAVYNGQYAKGLAQLTIAFFLVFGSSQRWPLNLICGLGCGFFYVYQIIDAVRSARAIQVGLPAPDPFGLGATFGGGTKIETNKIPLGALVLILLGVLFLLHTAGLLELNFHRFWGVILILLGGWIFATRWGLIGARRVCPCQQCRAQCLMGPAILVTIGVIGLIDSFRDVGFLGYVGGILLVVGGVKLLQGTSSAEGHILAPWGPTPPEPPIPPIPPVPPTGEVNHG